MDGIGFPMQWISISSPGQSADRLRIENPHYGDIVFIRSGEYEPPEIIYLGSVHEICEINKFASPLEDVRNATLNVFFRILKTPLAKSPIR